MGKRSKRSNKGLIFGILALITAAMSFISLAFQFISTEITLGSTTSTKSSGLTEWFDIISDLQDTDNILGWNVAKIFLIITLVLVGLLLIALVVRFFIKNKYLDVIIKVISLLSILGALVFFISTVVGCGKLSTVVDAGNLGSSSYRYIAHIAIYFITIFSILTSVLAFLTTSKK